MTGSAPEPPEPAIDPSCPTSAIDDGQRAWTCSLSYVYQAFAVGDLVQVTFSPRTGDLKKVRLTARPRTEHSGGNPG
jgi:hypothetical protein